MIEEIIILDEKPIKDKMCCIRGQYVMIDSDLARIYGYSTKDFNQQVKNNIEKFDDDFMFQLTEDEFKILMSKFLISKNNKGRGGRIKLPYVFTEQGIYMLMTVLECQLMMVNLL